ncbi:MAG TPA: YceI family protein [Oligoflexus sp.]|uniref:YceI family protein n=1 Tax=Oligoflexus sp. TaxID=1971216 RepID=UPI002D7FD751|nr:YceI family protein [Oligoflexus sp.]HET9237505.1 YceI family protein [Oligoflexus sp.]
MKARLLVASFVSLGLAWSASSFAAAYKIDPAQSTVKWLGSKELIKSEHYGLVKIKEGTVDLEGKGDKGRIVFDMNSIESVDLKNEPDNKKKLEGHLKSDDFFAVSKHPEATFVIKSLTQDPKEKTNYEAAGDLTIKGKTNPVKLPVTIVEKDGKVKVTGKFKINRVDWGVNYNSKSVFDIKALGDKVINNDIAFDVDVVALKK